MPFNNRLVRLLGELYNYSVVSAPVIYELLYTVINYGHLKETVKSNEKDKEKDGSGSIPGVPVSVGNAPHRSVNALIYLSVFLSFCQYLIPSVCLFVCLSVCQYLDRYDPRVFSDLDLPGDLFRAQLVCEALNTCGAYYVRGQAKERLSRFLVYFQRYLLCKPLLPTHIEFAILDTFDNLEELARAAAIASAVKIRSAASALKVIAPILCGAFYRTISYHIIW